MYLDLIQKRNPDLVSAAVMLHQSGKIPANTYVIDLDTIIENAIQIIRASKETGIIPYFMSKHFNRNPIVSAAIVKTGFPGAVAVDVQCAKMQWRYGNPVKHVGHLVQIPFNEIPHVLEMRPEVWTIFSLNNARLVSDAAKKAGIIQDVLLRVRAPEDIIYPNEEGGIWEDDLESAVEAIGAFSGIQIVGTVTFPGTLVSARYGGQGTINAETAVRAAKKLTAMGIKIKQINLPGASSSAMLRVVKAAGGTHAEPGHGIFGTTPWHLLEDLPERPAMVYVTEISHTFEKKAYCFGGGFYACDTPANRGDDTPYHLSRQWQPHAFVGSNPDTIFNIKLRADIGSFFGRTLNATDYYSALFMPDNNIATGDTAVYGFRAQAFTMRTNVSVVRNVSGKPRMIGLFDRANNLLDEKGYPVKDSVDAVKRIIERELD